MRGALVGVIVVAATGCSLDLFDPDPVPDPDPDPDPIPAVTELEDVSTFWLPINSVRLGASGYASDADVCIALVWSFSNLDTANTRHCDDFVEDFPYAIVRPAVARGCREVWDYSPNADVIEASGCIAPDFESIGPHAMDVTAYVASPLFTGAFHLASPGSR